GHLMRPSPPTGFIGVTVAFIFSIAVLPAFTQTAAAGPAWADPANWRTVKPIVTDINIVYATVPHIANPSAEASSNPGTPNGIRPQLPNTGPPGTMDMHLDVYQVA